MARARLKLVALWWIAAAAVLLLLIALYLGILTALEPIQFISLNPRRFVPWPWMVDGWFICAMCGFGLLACVAFAVMLNGLRPLEQRHTWRSLRDEFRNSWNNSNAPECGKGSRRRSVFPLVYLSVGLTGGVIGWVGMRLDLPNLTDAGAFWFFSFLLSYPIVWFGSKCPILFVGAVPSAAIWLSVSLTRIDALADETYTGAAFLLFLMWYVPLLVWAPAARFLFWVADLSRKRSVPGPLTELVALSSLMIPWMLAAFVLPQWIDAHHQTITIMASIGVGLVWGKVISEPFATLVQRLRALG